MLSPTKTEKAAAIKYNIHFGEHSFRVNEWLYTYFNSVKNKPREYQLLCKILTGVERIIKP